MDISSFIEALRPAQVTEFGASAIAMVAIVYGIGNTAWVGYQRGSCLLPESFVRNVNTPFAGAMFLRIATFLLDGKYYYFLIALDAVGILLAIIIQGQIYGYFLKKKE